MDKLWAPWRVKYVTKITDKPKGCVFCRIRRSPRSDAKNYVFVRTRHCLAVLNIFPYNNGHSLIMPLRHVDDISKLTREERDDLMDLLDHTRRLLDRVVKPTGYNVGMNLGRVAGAGIPGHLHIHVVPRWKGDVNFMPVVSYTKVISQSLSMLYALLSKAHRDSLKGGGKKGVRR